MKKIFSRNKSIALLLFLFGYESLFAVSGRVSCDAYERMTHDTYLAKNLENCIERSSAISMRLNDKYAFLYLKIPSLGREYLDYNLDTSERKEKMLPVFIQFRNSLINPRKDEANLYQVSSRIKEQIITENSAIKEKNCIFMAMDSEYVFPITANKGLLSVILYFDYMEDEVMYYTRKRNKNLEYKVPKLYFDQFIHRGMQTEVDFKPGKIYHLDLAINPNSALPRGSYNATTLNTFETMNTVPGFTITLKELPPNTKFAFDGKDDVGKTYEQVKKEFILYDKSAEEN